MNNKDNIDVSASKKKDGSMEAHIKGNAIGVGIVLIVCLAAYNIFTSVKKEKDGKDYSMKKDLTIIKRVLCKHYKEDCKEEELNYDDLFERFKNGA